MKTLDTIKNYLPLYSICLVSAGLIKQSFYYTFFNVRIVDFLDITEVPILFFEDLVKYFLVTGILITQVLIGYLFPIITENNAETGVEEKVKNRIKQERQKTKLIIIMVTLVFSSIMLIKEVNAIRINPLNKSLTLFYISLLCYCGHLFVTNINSVIKEKEFTINHAIITLFIISFASFIVIDTLQEVVKVKIYNKNNSIDISLNSQLIKSSNDRYYIGKTKNYVFYYDEVNNKSIIYPLNKMDSLIRKSSPEFLKNQLNDSDSQIIDLRNWFKKIVY